MNKYKKIFFLVTIFWSHYSIANQKILSLKDAIELVKNNNLEVKTENFKAMAAATDLTLIKGEMRPKINLLTGVGPINGKTGNYLSYKDKNTWGVQWVASLETKIPLYAWGKQNDLTHAATLNTEINHLDINKKQIEIIFKLKEAYYGWQYALSLLDFLNDTQADLESAIKVLENKNAKKDDLFHLEVFKYQLEDRKIEVEKNVRLTRMGVNFYIGEDISFDEKNAIENERKWIELDKRELKDFDYYYAIMAHDYPDLLKVAKGITAKGDLLTSEKKSTLPVFGGLVKFDHAETNQRNAEKNPFIYDPYNHNFLAVGIGLTWDIDFGVSQSKQDKLIIEIAELHAKEHYAQEGLKVALRKAYYEVDEAEQRALVLHKAYKSARNWLANIETSVGLGLTPAKDIVDAYTSRALVNKDYFESLYRYQMAWATLSESTGVEVDPVLNH
jgi:outer membrane protein TolC